MNKKWIGVDLDGSLAHYPQTPEGTWGLKWNEIGDPFPSMVGRIQEWLAQNIEVRIMTARVFPYIHANPSFNHALGYRNKCLLTGEVFTCADMIRVIALYTRKHIGVNLPSTCAKDWHMIEQWDDRAVQLIPNTGRTLAEEKEAEFAELHGRAQGT